MSKSGDTTYSTIVPFQMKLLTEVLKGSTPINIECDRLMKDLIAQDLIEFLTVKDVEVTGWGTFPGYITIFVKDPAEAYRLLKHKDQITRPCKYPPDERKIPMDVGVIHDYHSGIATVKVGKRTRSVIYPVKDESELEQLVLWIATTVHDIINKEVNGVLDQNEIETNKPKRRGWRNKE